MGKTENRQDTKKPRKEGNTTERGIMKKVAFPAIILIAGLAAVASVGWFGGRFKGSPAEIAKAAGVVEGVDEVRIPLHALDSGKALFLQADGDGRHTRYFVLKSSDGVYRAAYDACDVCFRNNRGYRQEGDLMVCNNCGQTFPSAKVNEIKGGCNPAPLTRTVDGKDLVIQKQDLAAGGGYFAGNRS